MTKDKEKRMTPEIRFKGFSGDWEQRKLNEISDIYDGTHQTPKYQDEGVMFLSVENIKTLISNKFISHEAFESEFRIRPQRGDVLITRIGNVGTANVVETDENLAYYVSLALLKSEKLKPYFLQSSIQSPFVQKQIWKRTLHIAFPKKINKNEIGQVPINIPTTDEQVEIGTFFKHLDDAITLHQQKYDHLIQLKKAYLDLMFPKNGESVPKIRFADFQDNWEQRKLSDVIEKLSGGASIKPTDYLEDGIRTIPKGAVSATGIADLSGSKYISEDFFEKNITSHVHTNNLVTSLRDLVPSAPNMGRIVRIEGDDEQFLMPQGVYKLELFKGMDEDFLISFSNSDKYRKIISAEKNGSTQVHIRNGEFLNIDINLPSKHEQKKIGTFFKILDNTITLHQKKIASLKSLKQAYLQKMFV